MKNLYHINFREPDFSVHFRCLALGGLGGADAFFKALGAAVAAAVNFFITFNFLVSHDALLTKKYMVEGIRLPDTDADVQQYGAGKKMLFSCVALPRLKAIPKRAAVAKKQNLRTLLENFSFEKLFCFRAGNRKIR